jgi:hypothetical protein
MRRSFVKNYFRRVRRGGAREMGARHFGTPLR